MENPYVISYPGICLLSIGSFGALYAAIFTKSKSQEEDSLILSNIILDLITVGVGTFCVDWLYHHNLKILSYLVFILPVIFVITVSIIVTILCIRDEKSYIVKKRVDNTFPLKPNEEELIKKRLEMI